MGFLEGWHPGDLIVCPNGFDSIEGDVLKSQEEVEKNTKAKSAILVSGAL